MLKCDLGEAFVTDIFRIAIVGSGPAGLSAAGRAAQLGLSHVLLEKTDHLSDTIYKYQKGKHVMATPSQLVLRSDLDFEAGKREKVLGTWDEQTANQGVNVKYMAEVKAITGAKGDFTLALTSGEVVRAENIILAIGTQGNPNLLRVPGVEQANVQYTLDDPGEYVDEHITVIGAGDAGIENALGLAADPEQRNTVTIINRSAEFSTAKDANIKALLAAQSIGRIQILTESTTNRFEPGHIVFDTRDGELKIRCDRAHPAVPRHRRDRALLRGARLRDAPAHGRLPDPARARDRAALLRLPRSRPEDLLRGRLRAPSRSGCAPCPLRARRPPLHGHPAPDGARGQALGRARIRAGGPGRIADPRGAGAIVKLPSTKH